MLLRLKSRRLRLTLSRRLLSLYAYIYRRYLRKVMTKINKSHQYAIDCFNKACLEQIGIKPIDDSRIILNSSANFIAYIKTYTRLDHTVDWHRKFIDTMIETKIKTLSKQINHMYGSHRNYIDSVKKKANRVTYNIVKKS